MLARDPARADELAVVLASLAEGLRVVTVALVPYMPVEDRASCWTRSTVARATDASVRGAGLGGAGVGARAAVPEGLTRARLIDSHTHLDACEPPDAELVAAATAAGVMRMLTVGTDAESCRAALRAAERFPSVYAAIGCHPHNARAARRGRCCTSLPRIRAASAIGETGLDYYRDRAPRERAAARLRGADRPRARARQAARDPHARRRRGHDRAAATGAPAASQVILHCFSMPEHARPLRRGRLVDLVRRQRHLPDGRRAGRRRGARPGASGCSSRPTLRTSRRSRAAGKPNEPAAVVETARFLAALRGVEPAELEATLERNAAELFGW